MGDGRAGTLLEERLLDFAQKQGYLRLKDLNLPTVTEFQITWPDSPLTARKNIERLRAFFPRSWKSGLLYSRRTHSLRRDPTGSGGLLTRTETAIGEPVNRMPRSRE